jgi:AcrR family transcriptional regulator
MPRILTQADVANFRSRLCDIAAQLFAELGYEGFNMRELAKRLGVSAMTPYRYFKDKDSILSDVRAGAFAKFADRLREAAPGDGAALGNAYAQFAIQHQPLYRLMFDFSRGTAPAAQDRRVRAIIIDHVRIQLERGAITGDAEILAVVLWSALHGIASLYLTGQLSEEEFHTALGQTMRQIGDSDGSISSSYTSGLNGQDMTAPWQLAKLPFQPVAVAGE